MNQTLTDNSHISHCQLMIQEESQSVCNNTMLYHSIHDQNQAVQSMKLEEYQSIQDIPIKNENSKQSVVKKKSFSQLMVHFNIHHFKKKMLSYIHPNKELSKNQFFIIFDKSSSFKSYPKKQQQKTSLLQHNTAVVGFRNIIKDFKNTLIAQLKKKVQYFIEIIPILDPYSTKKLIWDGIITIMRIYLLIWIPILIAFKNGTLEDLNAYTLNVCSSAFLIDLAMQTFTIRFDKGFPVKDRYQLIQYQINWWTAIELFSFIISLYFSIQFHQNNFSMSVVENDGWTKILLLLLIVQTKNILQFIENLQCVIKPSKSSNSLIELVKLICLILLIQHIFSCVWYQRVIIRVIIGTYEHLTNQSSWLDMAKLDINQPWHNIYLEALYFISVTTFTVGYGDITPQNASEKWFTVVYMFFCTLQLSYSVNTIGSILIQLKENNEEIKQKMTAVTEYMTNRQMSRGLQFKVREYLNYYWQQENVQKKNETAEIIRLLPEELQKSIHREGCSNLINKSQFFKEKFTAGFLNQLVENAYVQNFQPGVIINNLQNIYIIEQGCVEIIQNQTVVGQLNQFQQFGLKRVSLDLINETKYRTKSFTNLLIIPYASLVQIIAQNQNELEIVSQANLNIINECIICKGSHVTEMCSQVHYIPDNEKVIKQYLYNSTQQRGRHKRKQRDKFQVWKNELKFFQDTAEQLSYDWNNEIELLFPNNEKQQFINICTPRSLLEINVEKPIGQRGDLEQKLENKDTTKTVRKLENKHETYELNLTQQFEAISQKYKQIQVYNERVQKDIFLLYKRLEFLLGLGECEIDRYKNYKHYYKSWNIDRIIAQYNFTSKQIQNLKSEKVSLEQISKYLLFPKMYFQQYHSQKSSVPIEQPKVNKSIIHYSLQMLELQRKGSELPFIQIFEQQIICNFIMDQHQNLTRCTLMVNDSQSESNNNIDHSIIGIDETISKEAITQNIKQKEKFEQTEINAIFQNLQSNQTSSISPKQKSFSRLLIYFHSTKYANKMLQLIRPNEKFSKKHFKIIDDSASSYKHMKKRTNIATNIVSQNLNLIDFRIKFRMKSREFKSLLKQKFLLYFSQIPLIEPQSKFKLLWDFLLSIMRMYMIICMPIVISFHSKDSEQYHSPYIILTCLFFILDIILRAFTICYDKGLPLKDKFELIKRQFTLSTFMELFSIFCGIIIAFSFLSEYESPYILEEDGWPRIALLLFYQQIMNILQYFDTIQHQLKLSKLSNSFIELLKLVFLILLIQHFCCCLWVVIGEYKQRQDTINWLKRVEGEPWQNVYLESFYFMSVTMFTVGYGEIVPTNPIEKIFCICYMFLSTMQLSFSVNTIGTILTQIKENNERIRQKMTCINEYMREKQISQSLQYKVREYFNFYWEQEVIQKRNEQSDLIQLLPEELQTNLKIESAQVLMSKCEFFKQFFSQKCLHQLLEKVEFKTYQPGIVIENNDLNIFIIEQGLVEVKQQKRQLCYLKDNDYFGHLEMKSNQSSTLQYKTASFCSILIIPNQGIREVLSQQNEIDQEQYQKMKDISYCYVCQDKNHLSNECNLVHFVPDKEKVIKQYNFIQDQFRDCFKRSKKRHHFSASQDLELISNSAKIYQIENDQIIEQIVPTLFYEQKQQLQGLEDCQNNERFNQSDYFQRQNKYICKVSGSFKMVRAQTIEILMNDNGMKEMYEQIKQKYENIHKYTQQQQKDLYMLYKQLSNKGEENSEICDKIQNLRYNKEWNLENVVKKINRCYKQEFHKSVIEQFQKYMMFPNLFVSLYKKKKIPTQEDEEKRNASVVIQQYKQSKI